MSRISRPIVDIKDRYEVVVIGSGYGGGIAASRMSRAGRSVCLLEKGKEFRPGEYPDTLAKASSEMQVNSPEKRFGKETGLFNFHVNKDINVVTGIGLGGTSLINANVSLPPEPRVFEDERWPKAFRENMTPFWEGVERAKAVLKPTPYPVGKEGYPKLNKLEAMEESSKLTGGNYYQPPINVNFEDQTNEFGVHQPKCNNCGDCVSGCNVGAKNTTLMNYLPDAANHGAEIFTQVNVLYIEKNEKGGWRIHFRYAGAKSEKFDSEPMFVEAETVFLGAGTLGSTEILLRSKEKGLEVSGMLGQHFTGNGDVLGFGYNNDRKINGIGFGDKDPQKLEPVGPCITSIIDKREQEELNEGYVIEEGSIPGALSSTLVAAFLPSARLFGHDTDEGVVDYLQEKKREVQSTLTGPYKGAINNTQTYLVMTHDDSKGVMKLDDDRLEIKWPGVGKQDIFRKVNAGLELATKANGGTYVTNPVWNKLMNYDLVTVHPLGGCVMGDDAKLGVVNHKGQVYSDQQSNKAYDGLYVCDGAVIPRSVGVNPLLTISGVAEMIVKQAAEERGWVIDYDSRKVAPVVSNEVKPGLQFTERMSGYVALGENENFERGAEIGKEVESSCAFTLTIVSDDVKTFINSPEHAARLTGVVDIPAISDHSLTAHDGTFNLFIDDASEQNAKQMIYKMKLVSQKGEKFYFHGFKEVKDDPGFDMWKDTTTLFTTIYKGENEAGEIAAKGILKIKPSDFRKQMTTIKINNASGKMQELELLACFNKFFLGALYEVYIK